MHEANHPRTMHLCGNVWDVAGSGIPYSSSGAPRLKLLDVLEDDDARAHGVRRRGEDFREWLGMLQGAGYVVEWRELRACDYGAPTTRKRLFLIARNDGQPIVANGSRDRRSKPRTESSGGGMIEYVKGDATRPQGDGPKIIAHIVNNAGQWGAGFVIAVSKRWRVPELHYRTQYIDKGWRLGQIQLSQVEPDLFVANLCAQDNMNHVQPPVRYGALAKCLHALALDAKAMGASIHMPRIGCGLGGGTWSEVEKIISEELDGLRVVVYDWP